MDHRLRRAVLERLAAVEEMTVRTGPQPSTGVARTPLRTIANGWRELLIKHQPDLNGRCPVCSSWLRRRRWPCQLWVTAHQHIVGARPEPTRWSTKKPNPFRRPRRVEVIPRQVCAPTAVYQPVAEYPDSVGSHRGARTEAEPTVPGGRSQT